MNAGIWKIATAKLCGQCIRDMEDECGVVFGD